MFRLFLLCCLTVLLCVVAHHCAAQNIHATCASIEACHLMNNANRAERNYLSGDMLNDQGGKDISGHDGTQEGASNGQPNSGNVDKEAEDAIKRAQEKVKAAEKALNSVLASVQAAERAATAAEEKEVKEIEAAKAEADKVNSNGADDISEFLTIITEAEKKTKEKIKEAKEKAKSAVKTANDADTKLQKAKEELKEAGGMADKEQKKQKATTSETNADSATTEAQDSGEDKTQSTSALTEVKQHHKNAQLALYKMKATVSAGKLSKIYESIQNDEKRIEAVKAEGDSIVQKMNETVNSFLEQVKGKGRRHLQNSKSIYDSLQKEVTNVRNALSAVNTQKRLTSKYVESVKTKNTIESAKTDYDKVESALLSATAEEQKAKTALNNSNLHLEKMKKIEQIVEAFQNADIVYTAIVLSKEYEEKALEEERSASLNINEIEAMKMDDMTDESKRKITDRLDASKKALETLKVNVQGVIKAKNDAETYKAEAEKIVAEAEKAEDIAAEGTQKNKQIGSSALDEVVNAKNSFEKVTAEAQKIKRLYYAITTSVNADKIVKSIKLIKRYVEQAKEKQTAADLSFKEMEVLLTDNIAEVRQTVTQQQNIAKQALQHLKDEVTKVNSASRNTERQIEEANTAVTATQQAASVADAKREAQKVITAVPTAEKELEKAKTAFEEVKMNYEKIERAKHAAQAIIDANKVDQLYKKIKQESDAVIEKKKALDAIVAAVQEIFNECPKEAQGEMKSHLQTAQAAHNVIENELRNAQQADEKAKQLKENALTALTNAMKAGTPLNELQTMTANMLTSINGAQTTAESAQNALTKAKTECDKAEKAQYVASVLLSSVKAGKAVRNANSYKESVTEKKEEAKSAIEVIQGLHRSAFIGVSFIIVNHLNVAEEILQTLSQQEVNAANAVNKVKAEKDRVDGFLAEVKKPDTTIKDAKAISSQAKASEIRALSEEENAKDVLTTVTSDLAKIIKAKQYSVNVNNKSQQTSSKPVFPVTSEKKSTHEETPVKSVFNESENKSEAQPKQAELKKVNSSDVDVRDHTETMKKATTKHEESDESADSTIFIGNENSSNTENTHEKLQNKEKTMEKTVKTNVEATSKATSEATAEENVEANVEETAETPSNGAFNPFHTIFILLNLLFLGAIIIF